VLLRAESASSEAARLSRLRFDAGSDSFLQLISAESTRVSARAARAASDAALADAQISVFKALGGGWEGAPKPERLAPDHAKDGAADSPA
ncbi:RND transporter, partial [Pseudomonas sp. FW305-3-2-15-C-LB1]